MSASRLIPALLLAVLAASLGGCFLEDGNGQTTTLYVTPSLGQVRHATVLVRAGNTPATAATIALGDTGTSGTAAVELRGDGPFIIEVVGDNEDADYLDEATGTRRPLPAGISMQALVLKGRSAVGVTPVTDAAFQFLKQSGMPLTTANVTAANDAVRLALAPGLLDILSVPTMWLALPADNTFSAGQSDTHALLLAAMVRMPMYGTDGSPALALLQDLQADIALEGVLDGVAGGAAVIAYADRAALQAGIANSLATLGPQLLDPAIETLVLALFETADFGYSPPLFSDAL